MKECHLCHRRRPALFMMQLKTGGQLRWVCASTKGCSKHADKRIVGRKPWRHGKDA